MRRREFIIAASLTAAGLAIGLPECALAKNEVKLTGRHGKMIPSAIKYPQGGCTESSIASFDRGPFGRDPYGIYN